MSSKAIASPAPVLGDFRLCLFMLADPDLLWVLPLPGSEPRCLVFCSVRLLISGLLVLESNNLTVSRTRDLRSAGADMVGRTGPVVGEARTLPPSFPLTGDCPLTKAVLSLDSNRFGREIGLGIRDLEVADNGLLLTIDPPLCIGD